MQFPPMVTSCKNTGQYHAQNIGIAIIHGFYSVAPSLCLCVCAFSSMQFYHVRTFVSPPPCQGIEHFHHLKDHLCCLCTATLLTLWWPHSPFPCPYLLASTDLVSVSTTWSLQSCYVVDCVWYVTFDISFFHSIKSLEMKASLWWWFSSFWLLGVRLL